METTRTWLQEMLWYENYGKSVPTGSGNVFACSMLTIGGVLGSNRLSPEFWDDEIFFFQLNSLFKIAHLEHFWCQQRATPRITGLTTFAKNAIIPDRGIGRVVLGSETVDLFHVNEFQSRDNKWKQPEPDCRKCCDMKIMVNLFPLVGAMYSPVPS